MSFSICMLRKNSIMRIKIHRFVLLFATCASATTLYAQKNSKKLLFKDDFNSSSLKNHWIVEKNKLENDAVTIVDGKLQLNTAYGLTLWFNQKLKNNILIEYDRTVVMNNGKNDRLGDCNQFWMATDPTNKMFSRKGAFNEYDDLLLYYVGMGAHENTVTRMRRYNGTTNRTLLKDLTDATYLLLPNKKMHIQIKVENGISTFLVNGKVFFKYADKTPYTEGFFGLRTFKSRQLIDNLKVWQLK